MDIQSVLDAFATQLLNNKLDLCAAECKPGIWHQMAANLFTLLRVITTPAKSSTTWGPESRVPYLSRAAAQNRGRLGVHRICESISAARAPRCPPFAATLRFASFISSAQGPWDPSDLRVPYLPRAFWGAPRLLRPFRIASPISSTHSP